MREEKDFVESAGWWSATDSPLREMRRAAFIANDQHERIQMQVTRTIPRKTYAFAEDDGIATILATYQQACSQAQHLIYRENQYFWRRTYLGLETPLVSLSTEAMEQLFQTLAEALQRGVSVIMVLPDKPNVGRDFTDDGLKYLTELVPDALESGRLQVYTLSASEQSDEGTFYRPIYVHAKVAIVDDQWITLGSANLNNRGMRDDAELNVALLHPAMAWGLRILLMAEHLGLADEDILFQIIEVMGKDDPTAQLEQMDAALQREWQQIQQYVGTPAAAKQIFKQQAYDNIEAIKSRLSLKGHIVPYIRRDQAADFGVEVDAVHGWLDRLQGEDVAQEEIDLAAETPSAENV